ncbi:MAG: class I SAM-dependent methyltransferase [Candidatus Odinarchaeota archaeon]
MDYGTYCNLKMDYVERFLSKEKTILDVGCGDANVLGHQLCHNRLERNGFSHLYGVDRNPSKTDNRIIAGDVTALSFKNGEFQQVICLDVVEHVPNYRKALKELVRVASERIVIIVPTTRSKKFHQFVDFIRRLTGVNHFLLEGHYYEFFEPASENYVLNIVNEVKKMCPDVIKTRFFKLNYPIPFSKLFMRLGLIYSGLYIFDK